ncbi:MAG TPA: T9SS type A sorting domain-containing protein [Clostridiales bacterium]|nr:T9SS type A sorting domain-containing protein [Clostridiales bacterium]HQP69861.1 T9SS type A sorting domain-containing protein [Clostridiales bacterium]
MRRVFSFAIILISILNAQTIMWERAIPFETADEGPVGVDIAPTGDIMVACYTNGPNHSVWLAGSDSLISVPDTKLIKLDQNGNMLTSENLGMLFNDGTIGVGYADSSLTLIGNHVSGDADSQLCDAWQMYFKNNECDTVEYDDPFPSVYYYFREMKNSFYHKTISKLYYYDSCFKCSYGYDMLLNTNNQVIVEKKDIDFPDTLFVDNIERFIYYFYINDFDESANGDVLIAGSISGMYLKDEYNYITKFDENQNILWQKYYYGYYHPATHTENEIRRISATSDGGCIYSVWKDLNNNNFTDENENFLIKLDTNGETECISGPYENKIEWIYRVGENEYVFQIVNSTDITKIIYTGTELQEIWTHTFINTGVIRPIENGFISAGVNDNNIIIQKVDIPTGIEDSAIPSSTELYQNYPNPFNPSTEISYSLKCEGMVTLSVFNTKGELVRNLVNEKKTAGNHTVNFNGEGLNSGIYFYKLSVDRKCVNSKRMLMLK